MEPQESKLSFNYADMKHGCACACMPVCAVCLCSFICVGLLTVSAGDASCYRSAFPTVENKTSQTPDRISSQVLSLWV